MSSRLLCLLALVLPVSTAVVRADDPCDSGIVIHSLDAPYAVEVESPTNPDPSTITIDATVDGGLTLEYSLRVCQLGDCEQSIDFQSSPVFEVTFPETGFYDITPLVRVVGCARATFVKSRRIFVYAPGEVTPPNALPELALTGRGEVTATWPSHPDNTTIASYKLTLRPALPPLADYVAVETATVPDPANEAPMYDHVFSLVDPARPAFAEMLEAVNVYIAEHPTTPLSSLRFNLTIQAITTGGTTHAYMPLPASLEFGSIVPRMEPVEIEADIDNRQASAVVGALIMPDGGFYSVDAVRFYLNDYDTTPGGYAEILAPVVGDRVLLVDENGDPIPSGAIVGTLFANVVDNQGVSLPGVLTAGSYPNGLDVPQCWDGVDNDGDGLTDFGADPGCAVQLDGFEYNGPNDMDLSERTLIVYNVNSADAESIARYYAEKRGIDEMYLCPITVAPGHYASYIELVYAAGWIRHHICNLVTTDEADNCYAVSGEELAEVSPITHIVLIKGIPARLTGTNWPSDNEEPSFDYYLAYSIYHDDLLASDDGRVVHGPYDGMGPDGTDYQPSISITSYARQGNPKLDRMVAYGRIEAITTTRTFDLIDRTLAAEQKGYRGNFLVQGSTTMYDYLAELSSTRDDAGPLASCDPDTYLDDANLDWPYDHCRTGMTDTGLIPGEQALGGGDQGKIQSIPYAVDAGMYLGSGVPPAPDPGHDAFSGFINMINWRFEHPETQAPPCEALCEDLGDPIEIEACRKHSTDFFKQINTDCVGVADGFMGWQLRSWPVQYYGFAPAGWDARFGGDTERVMPHILPRELSGGHYAHFGDLDAVSAPICANPPGAVGETYICPERIAIRIERTFDLDTAIRFASPRTFFTGIEYRRGGGEAGYPSGTFRLQFVFYQDDANGNPTSTSVTRTSGFNVSEPQSTWLALMQSVEVPETISPVSRIKVTLQASLSDDIRGFLDLDNIRLIDSEDPLQANLIPADAAGFESTAYGQTVRGDWAPNAIDRLGGIAWWGSSSHHLTSGYAFNNPQKFAGAFFAGRTLGESLSYVGLSAVSGIIYGDPLYRPSAAKIYLADGLVPLNDPNVGYTFDRSKSGTLQDETLYINAFHGQGGLEPGSVRPSTWAVSECFEESVELCDQLDAWQPVEMDSDPAGIHGVFAHPLSTPLIDLIDAAHPRREQDIILRLRVWVPSEEQDTATTQTHFNDLTSYGYLHYRPFRAQGPITPIGNQPEPVGP